MKDGRYYSKRFGCNVWLVKTKYERNYDICDCCGKMIKTVYSITPETDGLEYLYGSECVKTIGLQKNAE